MAGQLPGHFAFAISVFSVSLSSGLWYNVGAMQIPYTYWRDSSGWFVGYWNDYPNHSTQGRTLRELQKMLRSLRSDINAMIADGTWSEAPRSVGALEFA